MFDQHKILMNIAWAHSTMSEDPSTKVGAVIANHGKIVSWGYNHIPQMIPYTQEMIMNREWKYPRIIHAEQHALSQHGVHNFDHPVMYCTHHPCERCAAMIIEAGIREVFTHKPEPQMMERWPGMKISSEMFLEARLPVTFIEF